MQFGVLGAVVVWTDGGVPVPVRERKVRTLLADLLVHEGRPVAVERLVDHLWGAHPPGDPVNTLQTKISQLRRVVGRDTVQRVPGGYLLRVAGDALDAHRFRELTARARAATDPRTRVTLLSDALALWRGPAFAEVATEPFAVAAAQRLEEERLVAEEDRADTLLSLDRAETGPLVAELGDMVARHPLRERLRGLHMRALYRAGRAREALDGFTQLRARLVDELGLEPGPELAALQQAILTQDPALLAPQRPRHTVAAPLTGLIGRDRQVADVRARLGAARLVTLTGPGGVGKTRLAIAVAQQGSCLVELAGLDRQASPEAHGVIAAVAAALGVRDPGDGRLADRIGEAVTGTGLLLVLDNCEQVAGPVAALAETLLRAAPDLRILATSREPLGVAGEVLVEVLPLDVPERSDLPSLRESSAGQLFAERAAAAAPGFALDTRTAPAAAAICRHLDGLPLALELAAGRVRALGVHEVLARLDDRFALLTGGPRGAPDRQRTLRAVIDWSWELLTDPERIVLRRLAAHPEGCDLDAAAAVCAGEGVPPDDVLDLLVRLVDRSLVVSRPGPDGTPRFRLLETVAAYGLDRMAEADELERIRERHGRHFLALAERAEAELRGPGQQRWLERLDAETANLRTSLDHFTQQADGAEPALRLATALCWYWFLRGRTGEAARSLQAALTVPGHVPPDVRIPAQAWLAGLSVLDGTQQAAPPPELAELGDPQARARAQWFLGYALTTVADPLGPSLTSAALATSEALGDRWGTAVALADHAAQVVAQGRLADAQAAAERAAALLREVGDRWGQVQVSFTLGTLAEIRGQYEKAAEQHRAGLRTAEDLGLWAEVSYQLSWLGRVALLQQRFAEAEELHRRAVDVAVAHGFAPGRIYALTGLALGARRTDDLDTAEKLLREVLAWHQGFATEHASPLIHAELGFVAEQRGDRERALAHHLDGHTIARRSGDPRALALALEGLAGAAQCCGDPARAARLLGAAAATRASVDAPLPTAERGDVDRITAAAIAALGEQAFTTEFRHGSTADPGEYRQDAMA